MRPLHSGVLRNDIGTRTTDMTRPKKLSDTCRLGSVGVLDEGKNLSLLLQCVHTLKDRRLHLYIYGTGPAEKRLKTMVQSLGISDKVSFMGWVGIPAQIWNNIDMLLFPSLHEGAPNSVLEAIGYGVPVLASNIPEHREILPVDSLVAANSMDAWVGAIDRLLADPQGVAQRLVRDQTSYTQTLRFDWNCRVTELILTRAVPDQ
jgi:glycosyltransferase involved in cell wall biosynthesis